jgi:hypothetical protein
MSFADLAGQRVDVASMRRDVLQPAEKVYVAGRRGRRRHLAIFRLRIGYDWTYEEISDAIGVSRGHACRVTRQVQIALEKISREIISRVALCPQDDPDALD